MTGRRSPTPNHRQHSGNCGQTRRVTRGPDKQHRTQVTCASTPSWADGCLLPSRNTGARHGPPHGRPHLCIATHPNASLDDAGARFRHLGGLRRTLGINGKQAYAVWPGYAAAAEPRARVLSANALVGMLVPVGPWRLSPSPKLSGAPAPNRPTRATIALSESDRPNGREPAMPLPRFR